MKQKIRFIDHINGKTTVLEKTIRDEDHLAAQIKFPMRIYRNRKKYSRKQKHKNQNLDD